MSRLGRILFSAALCAALLSGCAGLFQPVLPGVSVYVEAFEYDGRRYLFEPFYRRRDKREQIGKTEDGDPVYIFDGSTDFLEVQGSDNSATFIAEGCSIPVSGQVTGILVDPGLRGGRNIYLDAEKDLALLEELTALVGEPEPRTIDVNRGNDLFILYDDCNMSCPENFSGFLTAVEGGWLYVPSQFHEDLLWLEDFSAAKVHGILITDPGLNKRLTASSFTEGIRP